MHNKPGANLLADLRKRLCISQSQMAKLLHCTQSRISKIESAPTENITLLELGAYCGAGEVLRFLKNGGLEVLPPAKVTIHGGNRALQTSAKPSSAPVEQLASLKLQIVQLQGNNATLEASIGELKAALAKSEVTIANLRDQLDSERRRNGELGAELEQNLRAHRREMAALQCQRAQPSREVLEQLSCAKAEFRVVWGVLHQMQRLRVSEQLLSDEERNERTAMMTRGQSPGPLPLPSTLRARAAGGASE